MNTLASVLALSLVLLLAVAGYGWTAHTHAYVSLSDGSTAVSIPDDDWGVTCTSQASRSLGSAQASSGASVTWDTSHPFWIAKKGNSWTSPTTTDGYSSTHSPTYAHPYEFNGIMYGTGVVVQCMLWLENIEVVVPAGSPANFAMVDLDLTVGGDTLAWGHFMLAGDGSYFGDGWYIDSFFDVTFDGDNWRGIYIGPPEMSVDVPVNTPFDFHFLVASDAQVDLPVATRGISTHTVSFGYPEEYALVENTVAADLTCEPASGIVPLVTQMSVTLDNLYPGQIRRIAGQINVTLASGSYYTNWRSGFTNVAGGGSYFTSWPQDVPAMASVIGDNTFDLLVEDVTPAPFNQPPYPPAGDTDMDGCVVTAIAP